MSSHSGVRTQSVRGLTRRRGLSVNTFAAFTNMRLDGLAQDVAEVSFFMVLTIFIKSSRLVMLQKRLLEY
jgi:hypothetical protein